MTGWTNGGLRITNKRNGEFAMIKYMDKSLPSEERASALLAEMSISEKMGQLVCWMPTELDNYDPLSELHPHGVGHISCLEMRMLDSLEDAARLQRDVQKRVMDLSEHHIPAIFHMEGLCGAYIQGAASFPSGIGRASTFHPELEEQVGRIVGRQERAVGVTQTFAPVLDISRDSRMGRQGETYGEDPSLAAAMGAAYTNGVQGESGVLRTEAVAKHFLGFHAGSAGVHGTDCDISGHQLREIYAKPFQAAITEAGLKGVMPCYNSINGQPVSANKELLTGLLRDEMGFDGMAVSDYCAIMNIHGVQKVCESFAAAGLRAMDAGMDAELHFKKCFNDELAEWFANGKADIAILDRAVLRVLIAKFNMGLFEQPFGFDGEALPKAFYQPEDQNISLQTARQSLVLLKNDGILPLAKSVKKIAVIGCHAVTARIMFGGYTHFSMTEGTQAVIHTMAGLQTTKDEMKPMDTWPGTPIQTDKSQAFEDILKKQKPDVESLLERLQKSLPNTEVVHAWGYPVAGTDMTHHEEALAIARQADIVILTVGGKYGTASIASTGEGIDATDINLPPCQEVFIEKLATVGVPFVAVHFNGRPISSDAVDKHANALLEAWNPAEAGARAIVEVLFGDYNPGGKLPVSVVYNAGQIPLYYNHPNGSAWHQGESVGFAEYVDAPHTPRYFFGHGLSYTTFAYSNLRLNTKEVLPDGEVEIRVDIENTGSMAGDEVAQLYLSDLYASMTRPVMALAGFKRVFIAPGEKKTITFILNMSQTAFWDRNQKWKVEAGEFDVMVGSSSHDIRLRDNFRITENLFIDGKNRAFYTKVRLG